MGVILACYREFEERIQIIGESFVSKNKSYDIVKAAVDTIVGKFTKKEIADMCPSIGQKAVEAALGKLVSENYIELHKAGKNSFYTKVFS